MATLPTSCKGAAWKRRSQNSFSIPICSASNLEKRPMRSMCAPVSSSRNSTAIDRRRTVSACAISSSVRARRSSVEWPSTSSHSAIRRLSPANHPSSVAAPASASAQPAVASAESARTAPKAAAMNSASQGPQRSAELKGGRARTLASAASVERGASPGVAPSARRPKASAVREPGVDADGLTEGCSRARAASRRTPRPGRAGRLNLAWVSPLTGESRLSPLWASTLGLAGLIAPWAPGRIVDAPRPGPAGVWTDFRACLLARAKLRDVDRVGGRRDRDRLVPASEVHLPAGAAALDDRHRVGRALDRHVEGASPRHVGDSHDGLAIDGLGPALAELPLAGQRRVDQLAQIRQRGDRGEVRARRRRLQPPAPQDLGCRGPSDAPVEGGTAFDVDRAAGLDNLEAHPAL